VTATDQTGGPGVGAITVSPLTFNGGVGAVITQFDPATAGTSLIEVLTPSGFNTSTNFRTITATVAAPTIAVSSPTVGMNLQQSGAVSLGAPAPAGGVTVTLTSADPSRVLLSTTQTGAGNGSITLPVNAGNSGTNSYFVQGLADSGTVTLTASAPGYTNSSGIVTLTPSGFIINTPSAISTTTFSGNSNVQITSARLSPGTLNFADNQQLRGGATPVDVVVTATDQTGGPGVGAITVSPLTFNGGVGAVTTAFNPAANGTSLIEVVTPSGFSTSTTFRSITATVAAPTINVGFTNLLVGRDLQDAVFVSLGVTPPSPVTVTVRVTSTAIATLSTSSTVAGTDTITFNNVATTSVGTIFLQGRALGSTTVTVQAPGYADDTGTVTVVPSGFIINTNSFSTTAGAGNSNIQIQSARLDPSTLNFSLTQQVRGGLAVQVPVTAEDQTGGPGVGRIVASPITINGGQFSANAQFDPAVVGTSRVTAGVPPGFDTPSNLRQITVTVNP
jgi:hypothetical protein